MADYNEYDTDGHSFHAIGTGPQASDGSSGYEVGLIVGEYEQIHQIMNLRARMEHQHQAEAIRPRSYCTPNTAGSPSRPHICRLRARVFSTCHVVGIEVAYMLPREKRIPRATQASREDRRLSSSASRSNRSEDLSNA